MSRPVAQRPGDDMALRKSRAFTLIEVVAALAIVAIALLGLLRLHLISMKTADKARVVTQAVLLAQQKITETLCLGFPPLGTQAGQVEKDGSVLTWQTRTTDVRPSGPDFTRCNLTGLRELSVEVTWGPSPGGQVIRMTTYVAESRLRDQ